MLVACAPLSTSSSWRRFSSSSPSPCAPSRDGGAPASSSSARSGPRRPPSGPPRSCCPGSGRSLLGLLFVGNGLRVVRPEGRSRTNALALVLGVAMVTATVLAIWLFPTEPAPSRRGRRRRRAPAARLPGLALVSFALYCLAYLRRRPRPDPAAIIVLGSGLVDGTVPTLLAHRLDAALEAWRDERALGHDPLVVPSGGQGDDEPMAEGVAMTAYLVAHGIPPEAVATEDRSTTTEENLLLSREILRARGLAEAGHLRVVTSSYHVGRAALLTRSLGIDADVTGGTDGVVLPAQRVPARVPRRADAPSAHQPRRPRRVGRGDGLPGVCRPPPLTGAARSARGWPAAPGRRGAPA